MTDTEEAYSIEYQESKKAIVASDGVSPKVDVKDSNGEVEKTIEIKIKDDGEKVASGANKNTIHVYIVNKNQGDTGYNEETGIIDGTEITNNEDWKKYINESDFIDPDESDFKNSSEFKYEITLDPRSDVGENIRGKFDLVIEVEDNVGNKTIETIEIDMGVTVKATIANLNIGSAQSFKQSFRRGEKAELVITTTGYVSKLEISFPRELTDHNSDLENLVLINENPDFNGENTYRFKIKMETEEFEEFKDIVITGYNNYGSDPASDTVYLNVLGNITDDLQTRIRNNN